VPEGNSAAAMVPGLCPSLVLEVLWRCGDDAMAVPPATISNRAWPEAGGFVSDYLMPIAEGVYWRCRRSSC